MGRYTYSTPTKEDIMTFLNNIYTSLVNYNNYVGSILNKTYDPSTIKNANDILLEINAFGNKLSSYSTNVSTINSGDLTALYLNVTSYYRNLNSLVSNNYDNINNIYKNNLRSNIPSSSTTTPTPTPTTTPTPKPTTSTTNVPVVTSKKSTKPYMITLSQLSQLYTTAQDVNGYKEYFKANMPTENFISSYNTNTMPIIEGLDDPNYGPLSDAMINEKNLAIQLNDFNQKYERYIECNDPNSSVKCNSTNTPSSDSLITQMNTINGLINNINTDLSKVSKNSNSIVFDDFGRSFNYTPVKTFIDYQKNYYEITNNYDSVVKLRNDLDVKIQRLYNPQNSMISDYNNNLNSTVFSGILISTLATSILYYIFNEL